MYRIPLAAVQRKACNRLLELSIPPTTTVPSAETLLAQLATPSSVPSQVMDCDQLVAVMRSRADALRNALKKVRIPRIFIVPPPVQNAIISEKNWHSYDCKNAGRIPGLED
jgi:hypothetical protein